MEHNRGVEMNERIRQLADQQGLIGPNYLISSHELEKFAKLIIQDCISQIALIGISNFENDDVSWTANKSIENIRQHFGFE